MAATTAAVSAVGPRGAGSLVAATGPDAKFDLVIKGAAVLDPSQDLRGKRDIGIRHGVIEAIEADIAVTRAEKILTASGRLAVPGLIDLHARVFPDESAIGMPADALIAHQATTTLVSAGDAGASDIAAFRRLAMPITRARLFAFVHVGAMGLAGFPVPELCTIDNAQVDVAAKVIAENSDIVVGTKVRMSENVFARHGLEPLRRAILVCERAGTRGCVMVHISGVKTPELISQILDAMRPGDILTHAFSGTPSLPGKFISIVQDGKLIPAAAAAKQRGVLFDVGHGGAVFDYAIAEAAIARGAGPDILSSDVHVFSANTPGPPYLTNVMSKFLNLGFTMEQVVTMATTVPARMINRGAKLGTLAIGAPADVALLEMVEDPVELVDMRSSKRTGTIRIKPAGVVIGGLPLGQPCVAPLAIG